MTANILHFPFVFPEGFFENLGFKSKRRYVAFYWDSGVDYLCVCEDGCSETDHINNDLWVEFFHQMNITHWLSEKKVNLSTATVEELANCWLVVDMDTKQGYVVSAIKGREIIKNQSMDPPPPPAKRAQIKTVASKILGKGQIETKRGTRVLLALHELTIDDGGKQRPYFMVTRGERIIPPTEKQSEAVIVVAIVNDGDEKRLVVTNEYRPPIGRREISFPAGMIDESDILRANGDAAEAAKFAAKREFFEETGLELTPTEISPSNLYSSAGMTNESSTIVFGTASGTPSSAHCEATEDIETLLVTHAEMQAMMADTKHVFSKVCWPFLWAFSKHGF